MDNLDSIAWQLCKDNGLTPDDVQQVKDIIRAMFEAKQEADRRWHQRINEYLKATLRGEALLE